MRVVFSADILIRSNSHILCLLHALTRANTKHRFDKSTHKSFFGEAQPKKKKVFLLDDRDVSKFA